jgi:spore coat polysaccharide biosynthesis predicted glycosyltransferase SpsG
LNPQIKTICIDNNTKFKKIKSADIVFNANVFDESELMEDGTKYYLGPDYMILREKFEFIKRKNDLKECKNVFISFGGADEKGCTINVLKSLKNLKNDLNFHVIVGPLFNYSEDLKRLANNDKRIKIFKQPGNIIELMEKSDLAITAAGITLYELSYLGIPSLVIPQVEHQKKIADAFAKKEACINLGDNPTVADISTNLKKLLSNESIRNVYHKNSMNFIDGNGLKRFFIIILDDLNDKKIQKLETSQD